MTFVCHCQCVYSQNLTQLCHQERFCRLFLYRLLDEWRMTWWWQMKCLLQFEVQCRVTVSHSDLNHLFSSRDWRHISQMDPRKLSCIWWWSSPSGGLALHLKGVLRIWNVSTCLFIVDSIWGEVLCTCIEILNMGNTSKLMLPKVGQKKLVAKQVPLKVKITGYIHGHPSRQIMGWSLQLPSGSSI